LNIPSGYAIAVYTRIPGVRFATVTPDGNLLASNPGAGIVYLVRPNSSGDPIVSNFITGLTLPQDLVFHVIGATTYLYVAQGSQIDRYIYHTGDLTGQSGQTLISGLPDGSTTGLNGAYAHGLKDIALDGSDNLYVSLGSSCNVCTSDSGAGYVRGSIYKYNSGGSGPPQLFARGIRNAEGLAMLPGTNTLWTAVNMRDNVPYPSHDGKGGLSYQQVAQGYVDNHPPDEVMAIKDSANYGWPYCNPTPDSAQGYDNMPFDPAVDPGINNAGQVDCSPSGPMTRITKGIQAHSAPLGLTFLQSTNIRAAFRSGALIALHGSWDRSRLTGYKVIWMPWSGSLPATGVTPTDFVSGWENDANQNYWGRPVDTAVDAQGSVFITDDYSGTIYKLTYVGP
jgi:glucose/arabinose dehydrogenase